MEALTLEAREFAKESVRGLLCGANGVEPGCSPEEADDYEAENHQHAGAATTRETGSYGCPLSLEITYELIGVEFRAAFAVHRVLFP